MQTRSFQFCGLSLRISCVDALAHLLDGRFQMLPSHSAWQEQVLLEFNCDRSGGERSVEKPPGRCRSFYEVPDGEGLYFEAEDQLYLSHRGGLRAVCHPGLGHAYFSLPELDDCSLWLASRLFLTIFLVEILKRRGRYSLHAAGVSEHGRGIFIAGGSGAGKSSLTISLLRAGLSYMSDDMLFVVRRPDGLRAAGFPEPVDITVETAGFFPELHSLLAGSEDWRWPKIGVSPPEMYGTELAPEIQPGALVFPRISHRHRSQIKPVDCGEALLELAPNVLLTERQACQAHLDVLAELARTTPCYRLETGRDFDRLPDMLREILCAEAKACT